MRQKMCCLLVGLFPSSCPQVNHSSHFALKQTQTMLVSVTCCRMYSHMDLLVGPSHARLVQTRADRLHNPRVFHQGVYGYGTLVSIRLLLTLNNFWPFFFLGRHGSAKASEKRAAHASVAWSWMLRLIVQSVLSDLFLSGSTGFSPITY